MIIRPNIPMVLHLLFLGGGGKVGKNGFFVFKGSALLLHAYSQVNANYVHIG